MTSPLKDLGQVTAVIGAQWGDEGKGKIVDMISENVDVLARACGGANAGHTIVVDKQKYVFHQLPSGTLHPGKHLVLGAGMVIHLPTLMKEIAMAEDAGVTVLDRLHISPSAHIVFEYHRAMDAAIEEERAKQGNAIGTTKRGIGPAYMEKALRSGIRLESLGNDLEDQLKKKADWIEGAFGIKVDVAHELSLLQEATTKLSGCIHDTVSSLHEWIEDGKSVLIEGAQATLLDIDHGTYPYVTSSATTLAGAIQGLGLPPRLVTSCIGVAKAYCTRVGEGHFATEATGNVADALRERGGEYGATTGRPRRCGWLNLDELKYASRLNGFTHWNITKLDVLDQEDHIPYMLRGKLEQAKGWKKNTRGITSWSKLPKEAQDFLKHIEKETGVHIAFIGTGQGREEMIVR